jgi:hypothetical protein
MKRLFFIIPLFLVSLLYLFPSFSFAATCGDTNTSMVCGSAGGCPSGQLCVPGSSLQGSSGYSCMTVSGSCTLECGDSGTSGQCGSAGGCPDNNVCSSGTCTPSTCVATPTTTVTTTACLYGCEGKSCNKAVLGTTGCNDGLYCDSLGICRTLAITSSSSEGSVFCNGNEADGINTALGCIKVGSPGNSQNASNNLITTILRLATGVGGGLALALILYGVFIVTTSAGNPDKLKSGSEIITSAIIGLIFILLSIFLVNLIGINILGIPGLS